MSENVTICTIPIGGRISEMSLGDCGEYDHGSILSMSREDGVIITVSDYHSSECCEHVYADWEQLEPHISDLVARG